MCALNYFSIPHESSIIRKNNLPLFQDFRKYRPVKAGLGVPKGEGQQLEHPSYAHHQEQFETKQGTEKKTM